MVRKGPKVKDYHNYSNKYFKVLKYLRSSEWLCKCNCEVIFRTRTNKLETRKGCRKCTASLVSYNKNIPHYGYLNRLYKDYRIGAERRKLKFELSFQLFLKLISSNCSYCGQKPMEFNSQYLVKVLKPLRKNGIDRINSKLGYIPENVTTCCSKCNYAKHEMSFNDFKSWVEKTYFCLQGKSSETIPKGSTLQANGSGNGECPIKNYRTMI